MKFNQKNRIITLTLTIMLFVTTVSIAKPMPIQAKDYCTREVFIQLIMKQLGFTVDEKNDSYISAAIRAGIISKSTFGTKTTAILTKSDAAVVLTNAHEFLYGQTVEKKTLDEIIEKRISDIKKVNKARRTYVAKAYAYGYIKGASNGLYSKDRKFGPSAKIPLSTAKTLISLLKNPKKRHTIAPDGQLIRTTNLPQFAKFYPYILASFPNDYYDWEFKFMRMTTENFEPLYGTKYWVNLKDYAAPVDFENFENGDKVWYTYNSRYKITSKAFYELAADKWVKNAEKYLKLVFDVDYRTLAEDKEWYDGIVETDWQYENEESGTRKRLNRYISAAIENKTIVESKVVGVDKSSIYICMGKPFIRAYVKYRIISSESLERTSLSPIIFTTYTYPNFTNIKIGEWRDCYLDLAMEVQFENCGIYEAIINDYFHDVRVVKAK